MAKVGSDFQYCVKVQIWKDGFLKKTLSKEFFKNQADAERYYNGCEQEGTKVQLSQYTSGNERSIKSKNNWGVYYVSGWGNSFLFGFRE